MFNEALAKKFLYVSLLEVCRKSSRDSEYQVSFQMSAPSAALILNLAYRTMCIFSPTAYKAKGEEGLGSNIIGTGPFVQTEYTEGRLRAVQAQRQVLAERQSPISTASVSCSCPT